MKKTYKDGLAAAIHETATSINNVELMPHSTIREISELCLTSDKQTTFKEVIQSDQTARIYPLEETLKLAQQQRKLPTVSFEIRLRYEENSTFGQNVEAVAKAEHIPREEAAARVLAAWGLPTNHNAVPE